MKLGIDLGSRNVKIAYGDKKKIKKFDTISFYKKYGQLVDDVYQIDTCALYSDLIKEKSNFDSITATGYGRNTVAMGDHHNISEIKAHFLGMQQQWNKNNMLIIDIGGQDTKVIGVKNGKIEDFELNDNCAASTGRYLENMSKVLDVSLEELSNHWQDPYFLSSTCVVFGESEIIGGIAKGIPVESLCAGINHSIVKRLVPITQRFCLENVCLVGGVAQNNAVKVLLEKELGVDVYVPENPQFNGALGAWNC